MKLILSWSALIFLLMMAPLPEVPPHWFARMDLVVHLGLYGILGGLARGIFTGRYPSGSTRIIISLLAGTMLLPELIQGLLPARHFSLLDLFVNASGVSWGLTVGLFGPGLSYLFVSGSLLGGTFFLNDFPELTYTILMRPYGNELLWVSLFPPILALVLVVFERNGVKLSIMSLLFLAYLMAVKTSAMGSGILVGALGLAGYIFARTRVASGWNATIRGTLELLALILFGGFLMKCGLGQGRFLAVGGLIVTGTALVAGVLQVTFSESLNLARFSSKFGRASRTQPAE